MYVVHATRKLLKRLPEPPTPAPSASDTRLGAWYATAIFTRPQLALFVNERTRLPVIAPLAPAATLLDRFPNELASMLHALDVDAAFIDAEVANMSPHQVAVTANRSVIGTMNDLTFMASRYHQEEGTSDRLGLALWLAQTPCRPLEHISPDSELAALITDT